MKNTTIQTSAKIDQPSIIQKIEKIINAFQEVKYLGTTLFFQFKIKTMEKDINGKSFYSIPIEKAKEMLINRLYEMDEQEALKKFDSLITVYKKTKESIERKTAKELARIENLENTKNFLASI